MSHISENLEWQEGLREIWFNPSLQALLSNKHSSEYKSKAFPLHQPAR
jgi:hypothetical protein